MDTQEMEAPGGTPPIAVVILNWNGEKLLKEFLPKVVATTDASIGRIIVADNGSTDGSLAYVADAFPENVEVMSFPENYGFAEGYNKAVARCSGYKYVVLLNSDVATSPGGTGSFTCIWKRIPTLLPASPKYCLTASRIDLSMPEPAAGSLTVTAILTAEGVYSESASGTTGSTILRQRCSGPRVHA